MAGVRSAGEESRRLDRQIALVLNVGTTLAVAFLGVGVVLFLGRGGSPLDGAAPLDPSRLLPDVLALRAEGFLWLGILAGIATPSARVLVALLAFARRGERGMAAVSLAILAVIILSVLLAVLSEV